MHQEKYYHVTHHLCVTWKVVNMESLMVLFMNMLTAVSLCVCSRATLSTYRCNSLHSGHGSGMKSVINWPLLSPVSQFDMINVQFPLSPHSQLITISINKVCPTSVVDIIDQKVTSSYNPSLQYTVDLAKSALI